ncbi:MAG TPA: tRNA (guanosine(37)-N1)-methyltransferase TrmD [Thermoanaerobaculia bacterium]|nr:tRNA (guanosine(37)-N1)-methyltransferase TrmD [Thermoanaerobaculia bacterium]
MRVQVLTIFPELFGPFLATSLVGRAIEKGLLEVRLHDLRDFTEDRHRSVDDEPYGGGGGMVMTAPPWVRAVRALSEGPAGEGTRKVLLSPQGRRLDDAKVRELAACGDLLLMCGRYEGIDERVRQTVVDEEVSIGDYVLSGGELPAMVLIEALSRQVPGVVKLADSVEQDSFRAGLLDHPHYTRPPVVEGLAVPEVLTSGDHAAIRRWREREALRATLEKRPDLLEKPGFRASLTREQRRELERLERHTRPGEPETGLRGHSEIENNGGTVPEADAASLRGEP